MCFVHVCGGGGGGVETIKIQIQIHIHFIVPQMHCLGTHTCHSEAPIIIKHDHKNLIKDLRTLNKQGATIGE